MNDDLISIDNYTLVRLDRNPVQKRKGGGVCCYVRNDVKFNVLKLRNPTEPSLEYMWIRCTYGTKNCIIACIYHPPKPRYNTEVFVRELSADLENMLYTSGDSIFVLAGDFNSLNTEFLCNDFGLCQLVTTATHGNSLIDKVFVSHSDIFRCSVLKSLLKTKHMAILLSPASSSGSVSGPQSRRKVSVPDLREPYINKLRYIIGTFDWSHLFCADDDIDVMYCNFLTILHSIIDECIPRKYVVVGPRDPDFVTPLVKMLLKKGTDCVD